MYCHTDARLRVRRLCCALLAGWLSLLAGNAAAAPLSLAEAMRRTLIDSPELASYPFSLRAAEARLLQAGLRPNPTLAVEMENIAGTGEYRGSGGAEITLSLSQVIELGDKRERRRSVAEWRQRGQLVAYEVARLEVLGETARRYVEAARAQQWADLGEQRARIARRILQIGEERLASGAAPAAEARRLAIALGRAELAARRAEAERDIARIRLASMWGGSIDFDTVMADALLRFPDLPSEAWLVEASTAAPAQQQWVNRERLQQARLRLAKSRAVPDIELGFGVRHLRESDDNALVFSVSMPLQWSDRNQGGIAAASAELQQTDREQHAARLELETLLRVVYRQLSLYRAEAGQLRGTALPMARQVLEEMEHGYRIGRFSALDLMAAQDEALALQADAIAAETAFHLQLIELERLTGQPLAEHGPITGSGLEYPR